MPTITYQESKLMNCITYSIGKIHHNYLLGECSRGHQSFYEMYIYKYIKEKLDKDQNKL